jgi:hypothetical protein
MRRKERYVDRTRGLGRIDLWQESLERLLARRRKFAPIPVVGLAASAAALLAAPQAPAATQASGSKPSTHDSPLAGLTAPAAKYVNPLAHAKVTPSRIDQGVDYFGTGTLTSIGWARITRVERKNTGWPGEFIEYKLLHGYRAGRYVYYAEGVRPARGIHVGRLVRPGRAVAHLIPGWSSGIEIGWGANIGTETLAAKFHQYTYPTRCGKNFSKFIASLGGPPGNPSAANAAPETASRPFGKP